MARLTRASAKAGELIEDDISSPPPRRRIRKEAFAPNAAGSGRHNSGRHSDKSSPPATSSPARTTRARRSDAKSYTEVEEDVDTAAAEVKGSAPTVELDELSLLGPIVVADSEGFIDPGDGQMKYKITAPPPTRDDEKQFHFEGFPTFLPNLSPEEILRQGAFCGSFFRPVKSYKSKRVLVNDWRDLPVEWYDGLEVEQFLTNPDPTNAKRNKWKVKVGQSYEEWERNGWIEAQHDARGWFQWYYRFFMGRRCEDDARQVGRWNKFAGERAGRWRRIFYGKYMKRRITDIEPNIELVSKGIRQSLLHWAYSPSHDHLKRYEEEFGRDVANDDGDLNDDDEENGN